MEDQLNKGLESTPPEESGSVETPPEAGGGSEIHADASTSIDADGLPTDNAARTSLGRKLTRYEQQMQEMRQSLERMNDLMMRQMEERQYTPPARQETPTFTEDPEDDMVITTWKDVKRLQSIEETKKAGERKAYEDAYVRHIKQRPLVVKDTPGEIHAEIEREMMGENSRLYPKHTGDGRRDAEINYGLAKARVLERRYAQAVNKPNVRGDRPIPPTGVTATSRTPASAVKPVQLDEYAAKFVRALGKSPDDEWVQKSLNRKDE